MMNPKELLSTEITVHLKSGQIIEGILADVQDVYFVITDSVAYTPAYKTISSTCYVPRDEIAIIQKGNMVIKFPIH